MSDILRFPADDFELETTKVKTADGEVEVVYKSYMHLQYVANPVDADYQSLNVKVPVKVGGRDVDAFNAPILYINGVGGYMSSRNKGGDGSMPGGPGGQGGPPGGPGGPGGPPGGGPGVPGGGPGGAQPGAGAKELALLAGLVIVEPGCRGRDNQFEDGMYYGKAPAVIVDLKAAVRYLRYNKDVMPGNPEWIFATGGSAGGAVSTLLGASGNSPLYEPYLKEIGAADERDDIFASSSFSPITNLENADGAYEWQYGLLEFTPVFSQGPPVRVDEAMSAELAEIFKAYQTSLALRGKDDFGTITGENIGDYILKYYLVPSANRNLEKMGEAERAEYLAARPWLSYDGVSASFTLEDFTAYCGRSKALPSFDDFEMTMAEPIEFGAETVNARHFTEFSLRKTSGDPNAALDDEVKHLVNLMNPMFFALQNNQGCAPNWWIRHGAVDNHTSLPVMVDLSVALENIGKNVNSRLVWDGGHCADDDAEDFITWVSELTGYGK